VTQYSRMTEGSSNPFPKSDTVFVYNLLSEKSYCSAISTLIKLTTKTNHPDNFAVLFRALKDNNTCDKDKASILTYLTRLLDSKGCIPFRKYWTQSASKLYNLIQSQWGITSSLDQPYDSSYLCWIIKLLVTDASTNRISLFGLLVSADGRSKTSESLAGLCLKMWADGFIDACHDLLNLLYNSSPDKREMCFLIESSTLRHESFEVIIPFIQSMTDPEFRGVLCDVMLYGRCRHANERERMRAARDDVCWEKHSSAVPKTKESVLLYCVMVVGIWSSVGDVLDEGPKYHGDEMLERMESLEAREKLKERFKGDRECSRVLSVAYLLSELNCKQQDV